MPRIRLIPKRWKVVFRRLKGGPGLGNWGHAGRPGLRGGSAPTKTGVGAMMSIDSGRTAAQRQEEARQKYSVANIARDPDVPTYQWIAMTERFGIPDNTNLTKKDVDLIKQYYRGLITTHELSDKVLSKHERQPDPYMVEEGLRTGMDPAGFLPMSQQLKLTELMVESNFVMYSELEQAGGNIDYHHFAPQEVEMIIGYFEGKVPEHQLWRDVFENPNHPDAPKPEPRTLVEVRGRARPITVAGDINSQPAEDFLNANLKDYTTEYVMEAYSGWENTTPTQRGNVKNEIVTNIANDTGIDYNIVNEAIQQWAMTSNNTDLDALVMQQTAAKEFGVSLSRWQRDNVASTVPLMEAQGSKPVTTEHERASILRSMYSQTQHYFDAMGLKPDDHITLYRGIRLPSDKIQGWKNGDVVNWEGSAMESWSARASVAAGFGNVIVRANIPIRNIVGSARTGFGCLTEGEFVILGSVPDSQATIEAIWH